MVKKELCNLSFTQQGPGPGLGGGLEAVQESGLGLGPGSGSRLRLRLRPEDYDPSKMLGLNISHFAITRYDITEKGFSSHSKEKKMFRKDVPYFADVSLLLVQRAKRKRVRGKRKKDTD